MFREGVYRYFQGNGFEAVRFPYGKNGRVGMSDFLPTADSSPPDLYRQLAREIWTEWQQTFREMESVIGLPRFRFKYDISL